MNDKNLTTTTPAVQVTREQEATLIDLEIDATPPDATEVIARTLYTLISPGTELNVYLGEYARATSGAGWGTLPMVPGYAAVAEVEQVGEEVTDLKGGDLIFCMGPHQGRQRKPRRDVLPVPAGLAAEKAPYARLMNVTMSTFCTTPIRPPETVLVVGLGLVGVLGAQMFRMAGYHVVGVDPVERRRELATQCGITTVLPAVPKDDRTYRGRIGLVVECSAHEQAVIDATWCLRRGGEIVLVGVPMSARADVKAVEAFKAIFRAFATMRTGSEWQIPRHPDGTGRPSNFGNMAAALDWLAEGRIHVDGLHTVAHPRDCQQLYQDILHKRLDTLTAILDWRDMDTR